MELALIYYNQVIKIIVGDLMKLVNFDGKYFLYKKINDINLLISTANSEFEIHPKLRGYSQNIDFLKNKFNLSKISTLSQIHSDIVHICDSDFVNGIEGDGLVTNNRKHGVAVFTADCVPIFLFDEKKKIISAVHSGWRGTYSEIVNNSVDIFTEKYNSDVNDINVYIGPHNMACCYEVSEDLKEKFNNHYNFSKGKNIFRGNNLSLLDCIKISLKSRGIPDENINVIDYCTYCSEDVKFYSYRKDSTSLNRIFSLIFID